MGTMVEVRCTKCGHGDTQVEGPVMSGYLPRCADCGQTKLVFPSALQAAEMAALDEPDASFSDLQRSERLICEVAGECECGGRFSPDAPVRCSACRSTSVTTALVGLVD